MQNYCELIGLSISYGIKLDFSKNRKEKKEKKPLVIFNGKIEEIQEFHLV